MRFTKKELLKNSLSIIFGFFVTFAVIGVFFFVIPFINSGGSIILDIAILASSFFCGGVATASKAATHKLVCTVIFIAISIIFLDAWLHFNLTDNNLPKSYPQILIMSISGIIGGILAIKRKIL